MIATLLGKYRACFFNEFFVYLISIYTSAFWCTKQIFLVGAKEALDFLLRIDTFSNFSQLSSWL